MRKQLPEYAFSTACPDIDQVERMTAIIGIVVALELVIDVEAV